MYNYLTKSKKMKVSFCLIPRIINDKQEKNNQYSNYKLIYNCNKNSKNDQHSNYKLSSKL